MTDPVPCTTVFSEPPGIASCLLVGAEHGDVTISVALEARCFCVLVLTPDDALSLSMWLCAHVVDLRQGRQP